MDIPHFNKIREIETFIITCKQVIPKAELVCKELIFLAQTSGYICSLCGFLLHALTNHNNLYIVYLFKTKDEAPPLWPFPSSTAAGHTITLLQHMYL